MKKKDKSNINLIFSSCDFITSQEKDWETFLVKAGKNCRPTCHYFPQDESFVQDTSISLILCQLAGSQSPYHFLPNCGAFHHQSGGGSGGGSATAAAMLWPIHCSTSQKTASHCYSPSHDFLLYLPLSFSAVLLRILLQRPDLGLLA